MTNLVARLRALLPAPTLRIGRVLEHHDDDTSTVQMPTGLGVTPYGPGFEAGDTIRARGRNVGVGLMAFIRAGVVESQAPDGEILDIEIGTIVPTASPPTALVFNGPIPAIVFPVGVALFVPLAGYWTGGYPAYQFITNSFQLPPGISLNNASSALGGTATAAIGVQPVVVTASDATGVAVPSTAFNVSAA